MRDIHSKKRLILPIFITHQGCPHRCVFCNQEVTTGRNGGLPSVSQIRDRIVSFLRTTEGCPQRREVAFYGGTFTALSPEDQRTLLEGVRPFIGDNVIDAIRVSTRPDAIDVRRLNLLRRYDAQTVEIGAQSMVDVVLWNCRRGHTRRDVVHSVRLVRSMGFEVGIQIMLGLPGEGMDRFLTTVRRVVDLSPDFVRIYPLLVMKGAPLESLYQEGLYTPISLKEAVQSVRKALGLFEQAQIAVIRVGLQGTPELETPGTILAGPYHPAFRSLVESSIFYDMACGLLADLENGDDQRVKFRIAPGDVSNLIGERKENLARLKWVYGLESIEIHPDREIPRGRLVLENPGGTFMVSREKWAGSRNLSCS